MSNPRARAAITLGDVAGIGPEVVVRACIDPEVRRACVPVVVGDPRVLERAAKLLGVSRRIISIDDDVDAQIPDDSIACWNPTHADLAGIAPGCLDARAGQAAYDFLAAATRATLADRFDAIVTAPINKAAFKLAGIEHPGHTEVLAELCGCDRYAMMLYLPPGPTIRSPFGLGVAHVTLHTSVASVPRLLSTAGVLEKTELLNGFMQDVGCPRPRMAVCALNPHAGEGGLFGNEEPTIIAPAVARAAQAGIEATGPLPADTLFRRAVAGEFDGVVAMYHDQGHIAFKLIGWDRAVNVTLGLPIVRTSPSHGTAFDIAWQGVASADGMCEAIRVAVLLANQRQRHSAERNTR